MIRDLLYDGHVHTSQAEGRDSPEACLRAAEAAGLTAVAFCDHYGLVEGSLRPRLEAYRAAAAGSPVRVIAGAEADILDPQGRLSLAAGGELPLVMARLSEETVGVAVDVPVRMTALLENLRRALTAACRHPHVKALGSPLNLGRFAAPLTPGELPLSLLEEVGGVMREEEVAFELSNTIWEWYPDMELGEFTEEYARLIMAFSREGVKYVVGSGARAASAVGNLRYVARLAAEAGLERTQLVDLSRLPALNSR